MKRLALFFFVQLLQYSILVVNFRVVAHGSYIGTAVTDLILAFNGFFIMQRVAKATKHSETAAYVIGSVTGSMIALWLSIHILHQ